MDIIDINPFECRSLFEVVNKLMLHPQMSDFKESWISFQQNRRGKHPAYSGLTRILTGNIDRRTKKMVFSYKNWRVLGINLYID